MTTSNRYAGEPLTAIASPSRKILGFNGLRGLAVCLVFFQHKAKIDNIDLGWLGVWLFFALSGYLIIGGLNRNATKCDAGLSTASAEIKQFFIHRTLRIFPIYYLVLAGCAALLAAATYLGNAKIAGIIIGGWPALVGHALYLSNLMTAYGHGYLGIMAHLWTLSIEEQFYLIIAPVLLLAAARHHVVICAIGLLVAIATQYGLAIAGQDEIFIHTFSINNFGVMFVGGLAALAGSSAKRYLAGSLTGLVVPFLYLIACVARSFWIQNAPVIEATLDVGMMFAAAAIVLWIVSNQDSLFVRFLEIRPIEYLGRISYGFYLYHMFIPNIANGGTIAASLHIDADSFILKITGLLISFFVSVTISYLSWIFIEKPILRLKNSRRNSDTFLTPSLQ